MTRSHFIEILMILTKYVFDLGVRLTEFSVTVESVTLRFYCTVHQQCSIDEAMIPYKKGRLGFKQYVTGSEKRAHLA